MGTGDHPPLSKDTLPACGDADRSERRPVYYREACEKQTEADHSRDGREAGQRPEGRQVRGVLRSHAGNPDRCYLVKFEHNKLVRIFADCTI